MEPILPGCAQRCVTQLGNERHKRGRQNMSLSEDCNRRQSVTTEERGSSSACRQVSVERPVWLLLILVETDVDEGEVVHRERERYEPLGERIVLWKTSLI
jgi:hypothetical protein